MKSKNKTIMSALFAAFSAKAAWQIIIAIVVLVVGTWVGVSLYQVAKKVLPVSDTNQISGSIEIDKGPQNGPITSMVVYPFPPIIILPMIQNPAAAGFKFEYGVNTNKTPWIVPGTPFQITSNNFGIRVLEDDSNACSVDISANGVTFSFSISDTNTNQSYQVDGICTVGIERSTNLIIWQPIFTNQVAPHLIQGYTDPQLYDKVFYRIVRYQ
jgi:hypothetical protein